VVDGQEQVQVADWVQPGKNFFPVQVAEAEDCCSALSGEDLEIHVQKSQAVGRMTTVSLWAGGKDIDMAVASATQYGMGC
jgi:hypothetical protein